MDQQLKNVIQKLQKGTEVTITMEFCKHHGIYVDAKSVKGLGSRVAKDPAAYGLKKKIINPANGSFAHKDSANLCHYEVA